ncbi:protease pro-enzyme activation domain-containing protein [Microlunatus sp. GCM10028923]
MIPLPLTERFAPAGAEAGEEVDPQEQLSVTVYVRPRPDHPDLPEPDDPAGLPTPVMTDEEFAAAYGADQADLDQVIRFAEEAGLTVVESSALKRSVTLEGDAATMQSAFGVQLRRYHRSGETFRGRVGPVNVPDDVFDVVESVFGLDDRKVGGPRLRRSRQTPAGIGLPTARAGGLPPNTYLPPTVANLYRFPPGTDGTGQCVAILNFNEEFSHGGYSAAALKVYFEQVLGLPAPELTDIVVHGQGNDPGSDDGSDPFDTSGEVMLDVQMVGGCAPKAKIIMYWTRFTEQGWVDAINAIITDTVNRPSVISISYGNPEDDPRSAWTASAIAKVNEAFRAAAARGITICCASGDDGSRDQAGDGAAHADFPASSPYVLGCGGTEVTAPYGTILRELVWNNGPGSATGGGVSRFFPVPAYQRHAGVPPSANPDRRSGRGIPDVAGIADPETGVVIITLDGQSLAVVGGTSATSPMWASLITRLNQALGRKLGFVNPLIYRFLPYPVLRDITIGNNGAYPAGPGWDACTGVGSPDGVTLLAALQWLFRSLPQPQAQPEGNRPEGPPPVDSPTNQPTQPASDGPFGAYRDSYLSCLTEAFEAWRRLGATGPESGWESALTTYRHEVNAAYLDYVGAVKAFWRDQPATELDTNALNYLGSSMINVAAVAAPALSAPGRS